MCVICFLEKWHNSFTHFSEDGEESLTFTEERTTTVSWTYQDAISRHWEELLEHLDAKRVEDHLISKNKLRLSEREEHNLETIPRRRRSALLHYVHSRDLDVFEEFCHGLVAADQSYLAEMLRNSHK